ncbi:hypothetical protein [Nocardia sp. NPDC049149]|uniref:hypothetical protein n=1 Tax=Nocardia sp. NPDC049149 TaxID=3364315 RepID=UPI00371917FB
MTAQERSDPRQQEIIAILSRFTGYPDLPNGRPCGLLAYMIANSASPVTFVQHADGRVGRARDPALRGGRERQYIIDVPQLDPRSASPPTLYYAVIETNPVGIAVPTLPKGTQDAIAQKDGAHMVVELGQKRQLVELLRTFGIEPDLCGFDYLADPRKRREAELDRLHMLVIETLLARGYDVDIESTFRAAARETKEEHGFDFDRERPKISRVDMFIEQAFSKRRPEKEIEHYIYAAHVSDFDETLPSVSRITEDKDPRREGETYFERGMFLTLPQMWQRFRAAFGVATAAPSNSAADSELNATMSRLRMLGRIERRLVPVLRGQGIEVDSPTARSR